MTQSDSAKSTPGVSECSESTGQLSLFGGTFERLTAQPLNGLLPTPVAYDATPGGPNNHYQGLAQKAQKNLLPTPTASDAKTGSTDTIRHASLAAAINRTNRMLPTPRAIYGEHQGMTDPSHLTGAALISLPEDTPVSHSLSPGSDWAKKMTATYGQKLGDWWLSSDRTDVCLKTLLATSVWGSMTCYLTWRRSTTPQGRLLFLLRPSARRIDATVFGSLRIPDDLTEMPTPCAMNRPYKAGREKWMDFAAQGKCTPEEALAANTGKLNSAWVSRMMGYPDGWLILDGEATQ